jgi:two-component sensor histidine kinase
MAGCREGDFSVVAVYADGSVIEAATVGREGCSGMQAFVGAKTSSVRLLVQIPGSAAKMSRAAFVRAMESMPAFRNLMSAYIHAFLEQVLVSVACNGAHSLKERLARWRLMMRDRGDEDALQITRSLLAEMLGVQRPTITNAARELEHAGLIERGRRQVTILDRQGLTKESCECYQLVRTRLATERVRLEREHTIAGERIGLLLQELTHRVKNSLQIIAAMVSIEARSHKSGEGKAALERVSHRINALGQLYSKLGEANTVEAVDAATYLDELCRDLIASIHKEGGAPIVFKTDIDSELLPTDRAITIGLMVNELVTNAVKYAFPGNTTGTVLVTLKRVPGELCLTVADNGQGIDFRRTDSGLGGRLIEGFAQQLGGQLKRESGDKGTIVCLTLPSREAAYDLRA